MKKSLIPLILITLLFISGIFSSFAQVGTVRVLVRQVGTSTYFYKVINSGDKPVVSVMVGRNFSIEDSENELLIMPMAIESPAGWDGYNVSREESLYIHITWDILDHASVIPSGGSLDGFIVYMPQSYDLMKQTSFSTIHYGGIVTSGKVEVDTSTPILFDGKGQRPSDVNTFLAYLRPMEAQTTLPQGQATYYLLIFYGKTIHPETFEATLNGIDIKGSFHPKTDSSDAVKLNFQKGRNTLILSVDGIRTDRRKSTDTDRLTFIAP